MRPKYKKWGAYDRKILQQLWTVGTKEEIMLALPERSWSSIREMAYTLNLPYRGVRYKWLAIAASHKSTFFQRGFL